jgi:hypothetical protein
VILCFFYISIIKDLKLEFKGKFTSEIEKAITNSKKCSEKWFDPLGDALTSYKLIDLDFKQDIKTFYLLQKDFRTLNESFSCRSTLKKNLKKLVILFAAFYRVSNNNIMNVILLFEIVHV